MFGVGFWEIVVIAVIVIFAVPPRHTGSFFRDLGRLWQLFTDIKRDSRRFLRNIEREIDSRELMEKENRKKQGEGNDVGSQ